MNKPVSLKTSVARILFDSGELEARLWSPKEPEHSLRQSCDVRSRVPDDSEVARQIRCKGVFSRADAGILRDGNRRASADSEGCNDVLASQDVGAGGCGEPFETRTVKIARSDGDSWRVEAFW